MPDRENILGRIHIAVMPDTTGITRPFSYSKPCATSRPRTGQTAAIRAGLGGVRFINRFKNNACAIAFIFQHCPQHSSYRIQYGFNHLSFG